ncbi:MAG: glycoside hydrolase family 3 protein, partial [Candidatus Eremiobacteraeota bacterium]|nr:glycoside hydrolase family 3 protein [Candidatus Eremiobacteraeota bacterium]
MTAVLREIAAGVLAVGFEGTSLDNVLSKRLQRTPLAGVVYFARNIESVEQTRELSASVRELLQRDGAHPIVAIDQEGGRVARLRNGVEEFPAMMALAATGDETLAEAAGEQLGFDLRRAGVNVDFAPVLDLARYRANTVIGARSFGDDPRDVTLVAGAFAKGLERAGVVATFKHFPGHGSTSVDSHLDLPSIDDNAEVIRSRDLIPFAALLPHARAVMTAHIVFNALDKRFPATLSP